MSLCVIATSPQLTFAKATVEAFNKAVAEWPVPALEYKSFLRLRFAKILDDLSNSLESSQKKLSVPVPVGCFLRVDNLYWLHGRDRFTAHPGWRRELMRRRGYFSYPKLGHQQGQ